MRTVPVLPGPTRTIVGSGPSMETNSPLVMSSRSRALIDLKRGAAVVPRDAEEVAVAAPFLVSMNLYPTL